MSDCELGNSGSIDERGFINSFDRKGFTHKKGGSELLSNCYDAGSSRVHIEVCRDKIKIIDNGSGMDLNKLRNMFTMFRENHTGDKSMGVSGVGAKPSLYLLSKCDGNPTQVVIFTHTEHGDYLKAIVPFDAMKTHGKYTGMVQQAHMTQEEIDTFNADRQIDIGTTIVLQYSETTHNYFERQFSNDRKTMDLCDRLDCIFGKTNMIITYKDYTMTEAMRLPLYDYFSGTRPCYYGGGIQEDIIEHWLDRENKDRFVWENAGVEYEFTPKSKTISKKPEQVYCKSGWTNIGFYLVKNGMRRDIRLFDEQHPVKKINKTVDKNKKEITTIAYGNTSPGSGLCEYDEDFFEGGKDELKMNVAKLSIIRNTQYITSVELDEFKIMSARANADAFMKTVLHRTELSYCTKSCHENRMDIAIGIQENKNQLVASDIPVNLTRLISHIKRLRYMEIIEYFESRCQIINDAYDKLEKERLEKEQREEKERLEILEKERLEKLEKEKQEILEKEAIEKMEKLEKEKQEILEKERLEILEKERLEILEKERLEILEKEAIEKMEKLEKEKLEKERLEKLEKEALEKLEKERLEILEKERLEILEKEALEKMQRENFEKLEKERLEKMQREAIEKQEKLELDAKQRVVSEMVQTRISVMKGVEALNHIKEHNLTEYQELISEMLISYSDRCASDQLKQYIQVLTQTQMIDILLVLIDKKYQGNTEMDMKEGAKLFRAMN